MQLDVGSEPYLSTAQALYLYLSATFSITSHSICGSPPGVMMADTLSFNAKIGVVDF